MASLRRVIAVAVGCAALLVGGLVPAASAAGAETESSVSMTTHCYHEVPGADTYRVIAQMKNNANHDVTYRVIQNRPYRVVHAQVLQPGESGAVNHEVPKIGPNPYTEFYYMASADGKGVISSVWITNANIASVLDQCFGGEEPPPYIGG